MEEKTENEKFLHIQELAEKGNAKAQNNLGCYYAADNNLVEVNIETAITWWERASQQGDGMAKFNLAMQYLQGSNVEADYDKAYDLLLEAVELIDKREEKAHAYLNLGTTAALLGYQSDQITAYLMAAKYGDTRANLYLSMLLAPSPKERPNAEFWEKAKEEDPLGVQVAEAVCMSIGLRGYPRDLEKARELLLDAALKGNKLAAEKYFVLFGIQPEAATQEDVDIFLKILPYTSDYIAGNMYTALAGKYVSGIGCSINLDKAKEYALLAIKHGSLAAAGLVINLNALHYLQNKEEQKETDELMHRTWELMRRNWDVLACPEYMLLCLVYGVCFKDGTHGFGQDYTLSRQLYEMAQTGLLETIAFFKTPKGKKIRSQQSFIVRMLTDINCRKTGRQIRKALKQLNKLEKNGSK